MTFRIMTVSIITLGITIISIRSLIKKTPDTRHKRDSASSVVILGVAFSVFMLSVVFFQYDNKKGTLSINYTYHYAIIVSVTFLYSYAECHYADSLGTRLNLIFTSKL